MCSDTSHLHLCPQSCLVSGLPVTQDDRLMSSSDAEEHIMVYGPAMRRNRIRYSELVGKCYLAEALWVVVGVCGGSRSGVLGPGVDWRATMAVDVT
ncbi:hypothetical protein Nepgr_033977 [Nepenthes gracilis]|uniref:Uncharacterized protein n=1 Tax=Nepenthes gracilis TaxID=150966 RepID=A0AAD3TLL7_NEPGR|nr:hypothetical protein Nepgr_033977 [Nepenthes gracilis]